MTHWKCPKCGWREFEAGKCSMCGARVKAYQAGPPPRQKGCPNVVPDKLAKHMDYAAGVEITSRSQRNRVYEQMGLQQTSIAERRRKHGTNAPRKPGIAYSYGGQRRHKSTAERREIT